MTSYVWGGVSYIASTISSRIWGPPIDDTDLHDCFYVSTRWREQSLGCISDAPEENYSDSTKVFYKTEIYARLHFTNVRVDSDDPNEQDHFLTIASEGGECLGNQRKREEVPCIIIDRARAVTMRLEFHIDTGPLYKTREVTVLHGTGLNGGKHIPVTLFGCNVNQVDFEYHVKEATTSLVGSVLGDAWTNTSRPTTRKMPQTQTKGTCSIQ